MSLFAQSGSGWTLEQNYALILEIVDYVPLRGCSYIELPKDIHDSKAVINIKKEDQECLKWSILAALHPQRTNPQRVFKDQAYKEELIFEGIEFPVPIHQISKFEKQNPGISASVLGIAAEKTKKRKGKNVKQSCLIPLRASDELLEKHVVLLYWWQKEQSHYAWVKNFNRLLSRVKSVKNQTYFCERCSQGFILPDLLKTHMETCKHFPIQATTMVDKEIRFKNWAKTEETLFRMYADCECILKEENSEDIYGQTVKVQKHIPCSFAWVLLSDHPEVESRTKLYRPTPPADASLEETSQMVVDELITSLKELEEELLPYQVENKPIVMTHEQEAEFQAPTHCYMCDGPFTAESNETGSTSESRSRENLDAKKCRDHNHATREYRGAAHVGCNIAKKRSEHIHVFFHNLRGYDAHLIMQGIHRHSGKKPTKDNKANNKCKNIRVIPNNMEKYVAFQLGNLRFLESLQFFGPGSSLDNLANVANWVLSPSATFLGGVVL